MKPVSGLKGSGVEGFGVQVFPWVWDAGLASGFVDSLKGLHIVASTSFLVVFGPGCI